MKSFFGKRVSPNQTKTPDGFLVAHSVPIARTGWYEYLGKEVEHPEKDIVRVYRPPSEVFNPASMASFEGKPLTDGHPLDHVTPENATMYIRGSVQNVRQGTGENVDMLLADLNVYDKMLMDEIENGKREVSAGYTFDLEPNGDGTYTQTHIVGNHVAVVDKGRAGDRVKILDGRPHFARDMSNEEAAKKYGITETKDGHRTPPEGYPNDREQYADPVNYKYPLNGAHARDAVDYYNRAGERGKGDYTLSEWEKIGRRIVEACNRIDGGGYELKGGQILTPDDRRKMRGNDSMTKAKLPTKKQQSRVTDFLAAMGLKHYAQDAEPEELMDAVDAMAEEKADHEEPEGTKKDGAKDAAPTDDAERISNMEKKMDELMDMVRGMKDHKADDKDAIDAAIQQLEDPENSPPKTDEEASHTIDPALIVDDGGVVLPPSERPQSGFQAADSAYKLQALKAMKPIIAAIKDPVERKKASDAAAKSILGIPSKNVYAAIDASARQKAADAAKQQPQQRDLSQLGKEIAKQHNPHYMERK
jgi:hypothetical protein